MRVSEWSRASKPLAAVLPGFDPFKRGFFRRHEWIAECIYADSSSHSRTAFYVEAFALPLFVPTDHLYFDYGSRVGARWEAVTDDLIQAVEASLFTLRELATLDGLVRSAERPHLDIHHAEVHLCVALIRGNQERFHRLANDIAAWEQQAVWERSVIDRCSELAATAGASGEEAAVRMLYERIPGVLALLA